MKRRSIILAVGLVGVLLAGTVGVLAQPAAPFYVLVNPLSIVQWALRVDTSTTPNRVEIGCGESERAGTTTVNGLRLTGATSGNAVTITAIPCTGGDTNIGIAITPAGTGAVSFGGTASTSHTTFFAAAQYCRADNANLVVTRVAANDFALARTAAGAETYNISCSFPLPFRTTANKGVRIDSVAISYHILTAALTSHTFTMLATRTFANNTANAIAQYGGTPTVTLATAVQANPYLSTVSLAAPAFMNTSATEVNVEWQAVLQNTGVYRVYGVHVAWTQALY